MTAKITANPTKVSEFARSPNIISKDYSHAGVAARIQLTGHAHQAIPDVAEQGYREHWDVLNKYGEERWEEVFARAFKVREGFAQMIDSRSENIALASNVHDLVVRFLSALPLKERPRIVSTDAEHPSIARQLERLAESSIELITVPAVPAESLVERLAAQLNDKTAALFLSSVNFVSGHLALELDTLMPRCQAKGVELFVDAYLSVNVQNFSLQDYNLDQAFVVGGGSKYCQMANGCCFMHVPSGRDYRPLVTGWFGNFDPLLDNPAATPIAYADDASRFDGSSYDALSHFRATHVFDYFRNRGLTIDLLHDVNDHQKMVLVREFERCDLNDRIITLSTQLEYFGGFVSFKSPYSQQLCEKMRDRGVHTDYRKNWLRMGPAPYLCDEQLSDGIIALQESVKELEGELYS